MSETKYEPGTVAVIGWQMTSGKERALRTPYGWQTETGILVAEPTEIRPLVVLDLDEVTSHLSKTGGHAFAVAGIISSLRASRQTSHGKIADQIEAQTKPARIPEPGLWGVVAADGRGLDDVHWVHYPGGWTSHLGDTWVTWDELIDPTLVREGVSE